jgi:hypothetical protein
MADETRTDQPDLGISTPPVQSPSPTTQPSGHIDPEEFYALRDQNARYEAAFERLNPQADRIKRLVEDPDAARIFDDATSAMESLRKRNEPQVPQEFRPIYDKVSKLEEFADRFTKQQQEAAEAPQREFTQRWQSWQNDRNNNRFYERLNLDHPEVAKNPADMQRLASLAAEKNFAPLEDVWKEESWRFVKSAAPKPPPSLRSDAGEIGIPNPSDGAKTQTLRQRAVELERARRGIS